MKNRRPETRCAQIQQDLPVHFLKGQHHDRLEPDSVTPRDLLDAPQPLFVVRMRIRKAAVIDVAQQTVPDETGFELFQCVKVSFAGVPIDRAPGEIDVGSGASRCRLASHLATRPALK
jgi:hypothetical protein